MFPFALIVPLVVLLLLFFVLFFFEEKDIRAIFSFLGWSLLN